ncbi:endonuclease/exonuclease/phosphatase family protein [Frigidibacter sp. MR17.24]|uniref:endonuclease/exonuclease/phosphatase family protein n=1 Tax=Frigidibacter sp. MR17.24 TaxID=3127345 RepID=UPI003012C37E
MQIRLASYNIRKCLGMDRRRLPARTLDVVNALSADIVALQEVDRRRAPRPFALPPELIAAETHLRPVEIAPNPESLGWHGQSILLRRGLRAVAVDRIDLPSLEPRGAIAVEVEGEDGATFRVVTVHLALMRHWRRRQLAALSLRLAGAPPMPTAILGDFNEWSTRGGLEPLQAGFRIHAPGRSFPARQPMGRLDRVALSDGVQLIHAGVLDTPVSRLASDHLPIWADVKLDVRPGVTPDATGGVTGRVTGRVMGAMAPGGASG